MKPADRELLRDWVTLIREVAPYAVGLAVIGAVVALTDTGAALGLVAGLVVSSIAVVICIALAVGAVLVWPLSLGLAFLGFLIDGHVGALVGLAIAGATGLASRR